MIPPNLAYCQTHGMLRSTHCAECSNGTITGRIDVSPLPEQSLKPVDPRNIVPYFESSVDFSAIELNLLDKMRPVEVQGKLQLTLCTGCGNEIDPEICWCGQDQPAHGGDENGPWLGHTLVPLGCDCFRAK